MRCWSKDDAPSPLPVISAVPGRGVSVSVLVRRVIFVEKATVLTHRKVQPHVSSTVRVPQLVVYHGPCQLHSRCCASYLHQRVCNFRQPFYCRESPVSPDQRWSINTAGPLSTMSFSPFITFTFILWPSSQVRGFLPFHAFPWFLPTSKGSNTSISATSTQNMAQSHVPHPTN